MTSILSSQLPAGQTLEMPCNNLMTTTMTTATAVSLGIGGSITRVLRVDGTLGAPTGDGSLGAPFATLQQAITYAAGLGIFNVQLLVAPGIYPGAVAIPIWLATTISGYDECEGDVPVLSGNITFTFLGGGSLRFSNVLITATSIDVGTETLDIRFVNTVCAAELIGGSFDVHWDHSQQTGDIVVMLGLNTWWDGYSWSRTLATPPLFMSNMGYNRVFRDAGHSIRQTNLTVNGVAIGTTAFVGIAVPNYVRDDDIVQIQTLNPLIQDFICGVHGVNAGLVVVWITNLSRVSTNFDEVVFLTVHHIAMTGIPGP